MRRSDLFEKFEKVLKAKGQLGRRPKRVSHNNGLVQETVGSTYVCLCVFWGVGALGVCEGEKEKSCGDK